MKFKLKDIQPNPFRRIDRYPVQKEKVDALVESIESTGFWDNIVARIDKGKPQIAYGHHRLWALKEVKKPSDEIDLIIKNLSDEQMLRIMADENLAEWGHSVLVEQETVRVTIEQFAKGVIELEKPDEKTNKTLLRYAPGFIRDALDTYQEHQEKTYTVESLAKFLKWTEPNGQPKRRLRTAVNSLELIELGILKESQFIGLSANQAEVLVTQTMKISDQQRELEKAAKKRKEEAIEQQRIAQKQNDKAAIESAQRQERQQERMIHEAKQSGTKTAKKIGETLSKKFTVGKISIYDAKRVANEIRWDSRKPPTQKPFSDAFIRQMATKIQKFLAIDDLDDKKLEEISKYLDEFSAADKDELKFLI